MANTTANPEPPTVAETIARIVNERDAIAVQNAQLRQIAVSAAKEAESLKAKLAALESSASGKKKAKP